LAYNDPRQPSGAAAAKTHIKTYVCPTTPLKPAARDPVHGYGVFDYMFIAITDVDQRDGSATYKARTSTSDAGYFGQVQQGMLSCDSGHGFRNVTDGTSNTILIFEDAGRSLGTVAKLGAYSSRNSPVPNPIDPTEGMSGAGATFANGRRVHAWADPDCVTNGFSGPSNAAMPQSNRLAKVNNHATPFGGPPICPWITNNCGPNDEPFSFHSGGLNACLGDGSVRFIQQNMDALVLKALVGAGDGYAVPVE
jgi:prepilin-type processing-associated H-X9-DG protein